MTVAIPKADAATFNVTTLRDPGEGSLRGAVQAANGRPGRDTIEFDSAVRGRLVLRRGPLAIRSPMDIDGPGRKELTLRADPKHGDALIVQHARIFNVNPMKRGDEADRVRISDLTITGGFAGLGGAILTSSGQLSLSRMTITKSHAFAGGAMYVSGGLRVNRSRISGNSIEDGWGAGITFDYAYAPSDVVISNSTISDNRASGGAYTDCGGIDVQGIDSFLLVNSTVSNNTAGGRGGGVCLQGGFHGPGVIRSSTITGNVAERGGGGISTYNSDDGRMRVVNSTVTGNSSSRPGGGILRADSRGDTDLSISGSIVAGNSDPFGADLAETPFYQEGNGVFRASHSVIGEIEEGASFIESAPGTNVFTDDPLLGPLADNGGVTRTMLPLPGSPAIDAGISNGIRKDQRGRERTVDRPDVPNGSGSDGTDAGAVEGGSGAP